ncbi:hypothetical protein J3D45_000697 [Microbacterium foliorum]|nr:hypothetical protein [Microbacterium foliorum]MCP1428199.1 hypothetical protein [Microbacterium foliorum]
MTEENVREKTIEEWTARGRAVVEYTTLNVPRFTVPISVLDHVQEGNR